jgi:hypothetical protein
MTDRYMSLKQISRRSEICERTLRSYLDDIPHTRLGHKRGKIRIRWSDFVAFMRSRQVEIKSDPAVMEILREMRASKAI